LYDEISLRIPQKESGLLTSATPGDKTVEWNNTTLPCNDTSKCMQARVTGGKASGRLRGRLQ
jgi:hypothetical protein